MKKFLIILMVFSSYVGLSQEGMPETPKIVIKVPLGETIQLEYGSIKFLEVLEDSRCPTYLNCIWAGRAKILVELTNKNEEPNQKILFFGELLKGEIKDNTLFSTDEKVISGIDLYPLPPSKVDEERGPFELLIYIEKKQV